MAFIIDCNLQIALKTAMMKAKTLFEDCNMALNISPLQVSIWVLNEYFEETGCIIKWLYCTMYFCQRTPCHLFACKATWLTVFCPPLTSHQSTASLLLAICRIWTEYWAKVYTPCSLLIPPLYNVTCYNTVSIFQSRHKRPLHSSLQGVS